MSIEPFKIDEITLAGGGRIGICRLPGRSGDLAGDVAIIAAYRPDVVVSMTEAEEMAAKGAADLGVQLAAASIRHACFPIRDFGTPALGDPRWPKLAPSLHALLDRGGTLLLHCLGGLGRSGMVAMRLLVERGMNAEDALNHVRAARAGAVETEQQAAWASNPQAGSGGVAKGPNHVAKGH